MQNEKNIEKEVKSFKGFPLFNEIEDKALRVRNQAVILVNIMEDNFFKGKVSLKGASLITGYFNEIPEEERTVLLREFQKQAGERGFVQK